ncbi:hypothetical protein OAM67_01330 [bacterium]|nr:hypothetical protein [bacterium]
MPRTCASEWLNRMRVDDLKIVAKNMGIDLVQHNTKRKLCVQVDGEFRRRCKEAGKLQKAELLHLLNDSIFAGTKVEFPVTLPKATLCEAVAVALAPTKTTVCDDATLNSYQCAVMKTLKPTEVKRHWLTRAGLWAVRAPGRLVKSAAKAASNYVASHVGGDGIAHHDGLGVTGMGANMIKQGVQRTVRKVFDWSEGAAADADLAAQKATVAFRTKKSLVSRNHAQRYSNNIPWEQALHLAITNKKPHTLTLDTINTFRGQCEKLMAKAGCVNVVSQNCHFRPPTKAIAVCSGANMDDIQLRRACQVASAFKRMIGTTSEADIICLQEAFEEKRQNRIVRALKKHYPYHTSGPAGSGALTLSKYEFVYKKFVGFTNSIGVDNMTNKGMLITVHKVPLGPRREVGYIVMLNIHPSAYVDLCGFGQNADVYHLHLQQCAHIQRVGHSVLQKVKVKFPSSDVIMLYGGDFNINRYGTIPGSREETTVKLASPCCSNEFLQVEHILNAQQPPLTVDPTVENWYTANTQVGAYTRRASTEIREETVALLERDAAGKLLYHGIPGHGGVFSWDGLENTVTKNPMWPTPSYQLIDFVMVSSEGDVPFYIDNRVLRLPTRKLQPWVNRSATRNMCNKLKVSNYAAVDAAFHAVYNKFNDKIKCSGFSQVDPKQKNKVVRDRETANQKNWFKWKRKPSGEIDWSVFNDGDCGLDADDVREMGVEKFRKEKGKGFFGHTFKVHHEDRKPTKAESSTQQEADDAIPYEMWNNVSDHYGILACVVFQQSDAADTAYRLRINPPPVGATNALRPSALNAPKNKLRRKMPDAFNRSRDLSWNVR